MTVTEAVYCVRIPYQLLVQATGNYEATKNGAMQEAIINIVTSVLLVWRIGIEGVIIGTLLANVFRTVQYAAFVSDRILMRDRMQVVLRVLWLVGTSALICAADTGANAALSGAGLLAYGWLSWVLQAAVCFVIASLITLGTSAALYRGDLKNAAAILLRMRRR
jgi:peptidoglycan biosynthesis protein MviN/MurJ (putative lipid II flippase)